MVVTSVIEKRKSEHLRIVSEEPVEHLVSTMLEDIHLHHDALPELDADEINLTTRFFGKPLDLPLMITGMTGGAGFARDLNRSLARVANEMGIALGVGSQRILIRHPEMLDHFAVRKWIPDGVLLGNIGGIQLIEYPLETIQHLVEMIEADGICVHLNVAQELIQCEDRHEFSGILDRLAKLNDLLDGRVVVKETGAGFSPKTLQRLVGLGIRSIDVSGAGGTSWTKVEMYRSESESHRRLGSLFADWGEPTAFSIFSARKILENDCTIIGSGGIRNGLDVAKTIALGANLAGFARPVLLAFLENQEQGVVDWIKQVKLELETAMLLTGVTDLQGLRNAPRTYTGKLRQWIQDHGWTTGVVH